MEVASSIVKDGKRWQKSPLAKVVDNNNQHHTVQVGLSKNGNGDLIQTVTSSTIIKDGKDGKAELQRCHWCNSNRTKGDKGETGATGATGPKEKMAKPSLAKLSIITTVRTLLKLVWIRTATVIDPDENASSTIVKDGKDGKSPLAKLLIYAQRSHCSSRS